MGSLTDRKAALAMSALRATGLEHVTITAPEELEAEVIAWYRDVLGLEPVDKPPEAGLGGAWLQVGEQQVHISIDPRNPPEEAHFCLVVDDFGGAVDALRKAGCHIEQASPIPGRRRFFTRDPAGNRIEVAAWGDG
jgi:catechol 2,3-dioxygenase-like lactoylglutathione lyase family enzyme